MPNQLTYTLGDRVVIRLDCTNEQRMGTVKSVYADGSAIVKVDSGWEVRVWPDGGSSQDAFTVIKQITFAEIQSNSWRKRGIQQEHQDSGEDAPVPG